ncbi:hypothetical protein D8M24_11375 [Corynebacterium propinquum]|uniref:Mur ligase domain-containing protein n=1 Tax=Corynebacterium propinquum TaxID=43769 RepID=UPI000F896644|nr:Mur ligase domain-containing protein [Corynebacterium propinquum]RUP75269.1 hypothetical protein D8M24_11375 [Corynebacterium propinquum]
MSTTLATLLEEFGGELAGAMSSSTSGITISGIGLDSQHIKPGEIFAALPGNRAHGAEVA